MAIDKKIIDVIAPSSAIDESIYDSCLKFLNDSGFEARAASYDQLMDKKYEFCANSAEFRFKDLQKALSSDSDVIWSICGGYGAYQILDYLQDLPKPAKQKTFIGFSDATVLSNFFVDRWGWKVLHAPMLNRMVDGRNTKQSIERTLQLISSQEQTIEVDNFISLNDVAKKPGHLEGIIIGGCLSLMQVFIGTKQDINYDDKILLIEDDEFESPARVSRILNHMLRAEIFDKVKAVIIGSIFENKKDNQGQLVFDYLINELNKRDVPLFRAEELGHCANMQPIALGTLAKITLGDEPKIVINNKVGA